MFLQKDPEAEFGTGITLWDSVSPISDEESESDHSDINTIRENLPIISEFRFS
jgi:hypothetical protein